MIFCVELKARTALNNTAQRWRRFTTRMFHGLDLVSIFVTKTFDT